MEGLSGCSGEGGWRNAKAIGEWWSARGVRSVLRRHLPELLTDPSVPPVAPSRVTPDARCPSARRTTSRAGGREQRERLLGAD